MKTGDYSDIFLRLRLIRIFCGLAAISSFPYLFVFKGIWLMVTLLALGCYGGSFLLTFSRHHGLAKYLLILTANGHLFVTASAFGRAAGEQLTYIPVIFAAVLAFNIREKLNLVIAVAVSLICVTLLELTDYSLLNGWQALFGTTMSQAEELNLYYGNLAIAITCSVAIAFCYFYLSWRQQKQLLQNIQVNQEVEDAINYFATSLFRKNTQEEILWDIAKNCINRFGFVDCVIYLMNDSKTMLVQKAAYGPKNPREFEIQAPIEIPVGKGIVGTVAATGRPEIIADTSKDSRYIVDDAIRFSEITVPLVYRDKVIGVIDSEHPEKDFFQPKHLSILRTVAALASNKIAATKAEEEQRKVELIQQEAEKLKEIDQVKSRFFANISHEFRTPLTLILGNLEQMLEQPAKDSEELKVMHRNARRLLVLINQLLDLSKLESGSFRLHVMQEDVMQWLSVIASSFHSYARQKDISFQEVFLPAGQAGSPERTTGFFDPDALEKIVYNLLSNAFKFTPAGGKVIFNVQHKDEKLVFCVQDNGQGIPEADLPHIFTRFYQAAGDNPELRDPGGTGIGLALTKELVELHHGTISVESESGRGSTFTVTIPLAASAYTERELASGKTVSKSFIPRYKEEPDEKEEREHEVPDASKHVVLIVEDHRDMRAYIAGRLGSDYALLESANGEEGWQQAVEQIPDLVICDLMMPRMDGYAFCRKLREDMRTSHIPVIMLTARADQASKIKGWETGVDAYLVKPFDARELKTLAGNLLEQRQKLRQQFSKTVWLEPQKITITPADARFLEQAKETIEQHLDETTFTVEGFQQCMTMSRMQLHRKLKALTGQSASEFMRTLRLLRAAALLKQHSDPVSQVAWQTGFNSLSYFTKCFKEQFGCTPSEYSGSSG